MKKLSHSILSILLALVLLAGAPVSAPLTANAAELDNFQDFEIDGEHYYYSALDYSRNVLLNPNSTDAEKNLARATYLYNQAANEYVAP